MISVLIVEDDTTKFGRVFQTLVSSGIRSDSITHALTSAEALKNLRTTNFDLMLLDVNIPRRLGEAPLRGGGVELLNELNRETGIHKPHYIVGLTAYEDVVTEFGEKFTDLLWTLVYYADNSDHWISRIKAKVEYIRAVRNSRNFSDGKTFGVDLGIICALEGVEFDAVRSLNCGWQPLRLGSDETRYLSGTLQTNDRPYSVISAAAPRMGMSASAVLASKMIAQFRPKVLAMVGICAGRAEKTSLGDIIVADPTWDWGSGKIDVVDNKPRFRPAPHQLELDTDVSAQLKEFSSNVELLARIKHLARGKKPREELRVHLGPLASGAAVVANVEVFEGLLDQHRNLLGIEMEGYAVASASKGSGKPRPKVVVIKSVCDFADKNKTDDFQEYAAHTSALFLYHAAAKLIEL